MNEQLYVMKQTYQYDKIGRLPLIVLPQMLKYNSPVKKDQPTGTVPKLA